MKAVLIGLAVAVQLLIFVGVHQNMTIQEQRKQILDMYRNPACRYIPAEAK